MLLRLLPDRFRERYGEEMRRMFEEQWQESGWRRRGLLGLRAVRDVIWTSVVVRMTREDAHLRNRERTGMLTGMSADARVAIRGLRRRPAYALTGIVTIAMGIAATTSVFSVVNATVLGGLGLPNEERLVALWATYDQQPGREFAVSAAEFTDLRTEVRSLDAVGGYWAGTILLEPRAGGDARTAQAAFTVGDIYGLVGAHTVAGRLPGPGESRVGSPRVALLSWGLWSSAYGSDPEVVRGGSLTVDSQQYEIIGVLAADVKLPGQQADVWVHTVLDSASWITNRSGHGIVALASMREAASVAEVRRELKDLERSWSVRYAGQHSFGVAGHRANAMLLGERVLGSTRRVAVVLGLSAALLLALACANVANLLLARGETRKTEIGVRIALGASGGRVARPVLIEGLAIGAGGGFLGLIMAVLGLPVLMELAPQNLPGRAAISINGTVVLVAIVLSVVTGLVFTLGPALRSARGHPMTLMRLGGRGRTGPMRGLRLLVGGQVALATVLLAGATLLTRSLFALNAVDPGLEPSGRIAFDLTLPVARYRDATSIATFYGGLQQRLERLLTVSEVSVVRNLPIRDDQRFENLLREGTTGHVNHQGVVVQAASAGYLRTLGALLLEGRDLEGFDREGTVKVALVNDVAAQSIWPGGSAIGKRVRATFTPDSFGLITVVGVYKGMRSTSLTAAPQPEIVLSVPQVAQFTGWIRNLTVVLHTSSSAKTVIPAVRAAIAELDPSIAVESPTTLSDVLRASTARERFLATLLAVFSGLALTIAAVGVFGVVSFTVTRQRHEFAIRNTLGARRIEIIRGVLHSNAAVACTGAIAGAVMAAVSAPVLRSFLYGVAPRDGWILSSVAVTLILVALAASLLPAIRATRIPPARALLSGD
jgi:predicted permease